MAVSLEEFVECLAQSGLLSADEVSSYTDGLPAEKRPKDVQQLAKALIRDGRLTKYQASIIYQGKQGTLMFGEYVVLDRIGAGGMGVVLKAQHRRMKRVVAIKVLPPSAIKADTVDRFYREVEAAAKLNHPNIVTAYDAGEHQGMHFLVMEFVDGRDLASIVKESGVLPVAQVVDWISQAAKGLEFAHGLGVVHRDIKPGNLLLSRDGQVKILDMGLARFEDEPSFNDSGANSQLTATGQIMGTVDYMSPEQARDTHSADQRSDIYSLGCTLFRLLTGECLYEGDTMMIKLLAHREEPIPSLHDRRDDVPEALDDVFRRMVAKRPGDRYQSMSEVIVALRACLGPGGPPPERHVLDDPPANDDLFSSFFANLGGMKGSTVSSGPAVSPLRPALVGAEDTIPRESDSTDPVLAGGGPLDPAGSSSGIRKLRSSRSRLFAAVALAGLAGVAVLFFLFWRRAAKPAPGGPADGEIVQLASVSIGDTITPETGWVDLASLVDAEKDAVTGAWKNEAGTLIAAPGFHLQCYLPVAPEGSFELVATVRFQHERDVVIALPVGGGASCFALNMSGSYALLGLKNFAQQDAANPTARSYSLRDSMDHRFSIAVRRQGEQLDIEVKKEGQRFVQWLGKAAECGVPDYWKLPEDRLLAVNADSGATFSVLRLRMLDGHAKLVHPTSLGGATPGKQAAAIDPDRRAAAWVLSVGGNVNFQTASKAPAKTAANAKQLPDEPFQLTSVRLVNCASATAEGLEKLRGLQQIKSLDLGSSPVADGMAVIGTLTSLETLGLGDVTIGGGPSGLEQLGTLVNLKSLNLRLARNVADERLRHLAPLARLEDLNLEGTDVDGSALEHLGNLTQLRVLTLRNTGVRDDALKFLKPFTQLESLDLLGTPLKGAGLSTVAGLPRLSTLNLASSKLTGQGLAQLSGGCRELRTLDLTNCQDLADGDLAPLAELPRLESLYLGETRLTDQGLEHVGKLFGLVNLRVNRMAVGDKGMEHLQNLKSLTTLNLTGTDVTDKGLAFVGKLPRLKTLNLDGTQTSDGGLMSLKGLTTLTALTVATTRVTQQGVDQLQAALPKCKVTR